MTGCITSGVPPVFGGIGGGGGGEEGLVTSHA